MAIALDPREPYDYVLQSDRDLPKEEQTVFQLCRLSARDAARLDDEQLRGKQRDDGVEVSVLQAQHRLAVLHAGLKGWSNFKRKDSTEVEFREKGKFGDTGRRIQAGSLDMVNPAHAQEIADEILSSASLTEEQAGN